MDEISSPLRLTFLIHFFVGIIFGLIYLIFLEFYNTLVGWTYDDPIAGRVLGAALIGFGVASLLAWRETEWVKVKIIVQMEIVWLTIAVVAQFWAAFTLFPPIVIWVNIGLMIVFLVAFIWFYWRQEKG